MTSNACEFPRCNQAAQFCFADEPDIPRFCSDHRDDSMVAMKTCEFPRCSEKPLYTFVDDITTPHFCATHKSLEMILANGVERPTGGATATRSAPTPASPAPAAPAPVPTGPSEEALELCFKYFALKPEHDELDSIKGEASTHQKKLDALRSKVKQEAESIHKTSQSIEKLEKQISTQENKFIDCFGKSLFGFGLFMKDNKVIEKKTAALKKDEERKAQLQGAKAQDETELAELKTEQARLDDLVEVRNALEARIQELRSTCLEYEGTTELRRLQSKHQAHERMQASLKYCRQDVAQAHQMFKKALDIQAVAARSNAMAGAANIGQAIGDGGGRGIGQSPGERMLQIKRNRATKQSIEIAKSATDKLNKAQDRLNNDLRVHFPEDMAGVGVVEVPDLWHGTFFKDFLVGQAAGNVGDAINQAKAMVKIRKNMEMLETVIAACAQQEKQLLVVNTKLDTKTNTLNDQVAAEERRILDIVRTAAEKKQAAMKGISTAC